MKYPLLVIVSCSLSLHSCLPVTSGLTPSVIVKPAHSGLEWNAGPTKVKLHPQIANYDTGIPNYGHYSFIRVDANGKTKKATCRTGLRHETDWRFASSSEATDRKEVGSHSSIAQKHVRVLRDFTNTYIFIQETTSNEGEGDSKTFTLVKWDGKFTCYDVSFPKDAYMLSYKVNPNDPMAGAYDDRSPFVTAITSEKISIRLQNGKLRDYPLSALTKHKLP